ncbi:MAG TPA: DUF72 domain-containing protein, partial [Thermomicrobiales bacterium]|nr:DUF72 domain-containing protein [Thermomicrobiales bacterium]
MGRVLVGTSSWSGHHPFYPPGTRSADQLPFYATRFPVVEVNTTYYGVPIQTTVQGWADRTPDDFIFDVKPPRELTSTPESPGGDPPEPDADLASTFLDALQPLVTARKLGALTFQFPPSYRNTEEHREYLQILPELFPDIPIAVEFRRRDWLDADHADATLALLENAGLSYTLVDEPQRGTGSVPPVFGVTAPSLALIRFHGRNAAHWYSFSGSSKGRFDWYYQPEELQEWIPRIRRA